MTKWDLFRHLNQAHAIQELEAEAAVDAHELDHEQHTWAHPLRDLYTWDDEGKGQA